MARRSTAELLFDALSIEGGLLPPEWLAKVAALQAPAQKAEDYQVPKGLELRDEITRYWRMAEALHTEYVKAREHARDNGVNATQAFIRQLLIQVFGFSDLQSGVLREEQGRHFQSTFEAGSGRVPVVVGAPSESLDMASQRHGDGVRRRTAWGALQEYLNAADRVLWGIATNGVLLRIGRDNSSLTRPAWIEADLERIFSEERFADFSVFWLVVHASRFGRTGAPPTECPLELWREDARKEGTRARDQLRDGVEAALRLLGNGFLAHAANRELRDALANGELTPPDYFSELLRLVYRMIFLLTIEERDILHDDPVPSSVRALYAEGYGMRRLRERSVRRNQYDRHADLWASIKPVFAGLGRSGGEPALGLPELGGLFANAQCLHLDRSELANASLLEAVFRLAWLRANNGLARVNWKDMGPEELGSVYESLLELVPVITDDNHAFEFANAAESAGNERKLTGSYYTPDSLVQQLLDTALEPVVEARLAENPEDRESAVLSMTVIDPACGSGHFLLAAARRLATRLATIRAGGTPGAHDYRLALRDVVTHCIYGVDRNPMALELARMALWLEAYTPDRALGFIDHHLIEGDSLLGLLDLGELKEGIPDDAFKALSGDDKDAVRVVKAVNRKAREQLKRRIGTQIELEPAVFEMSDSFAKLDVLADDNIETVSAKRELFERLRTEAHSSRAALAADMLVGAFLLPKKLPPGKAAISEAMALAAYPTTGTLQMALDGTLSPEHLAARSARDACRRAGVLHWQLAFPQVFARGGFDVVIGNPPWERIKLQEHEFFAARVPSIANASRKAARERAINALAVAEIGSPERTVYEEFVATKQRSEAVGAFCRSAARYELSGSGDVNTYALFAETAFRLRTREGFCGLIVPSGIATDDTTKRLFQEFCRDQLVSMYDFENRDGIFPSIHKSYRFALLTLGRSWRMEFVFFATQVAHISDPRRKFALTVQQLESINPNTLAAPTFRSAHDAEIVERIYSRVPALAVEGRSKASSSWDAYYLRMVHYGDHADELYTRARAMDEGFARIGNRWEGNGVTLLPVYESRLVNSYDHRYASYLNDDDVVQVTEHDKKDPHFAVQPRYWVTSRFFESILGKYNYSRSWFLAYRDVTRATDVRTVIATAIPRVPAAVTLPVLGLPDGAPAHVLLANMNTLVLDYVARQKITGMHLTFTQLKQLPLVPVERYTAAMFAFITSRVARLVYTAADMAPFAEAVGVTGPPEPLEEHDRAQLRAELDALYAHLYGLTRDELRYILDPADVMGTDYPSETFRVLKNNEMQRYGEYRTRRLVLHAWDQLDRLLLGESSVEVRAAQ